MHGINYVAYENQINGNINSIMTNIFRKYKYTPQVSFNDCKNFDIILNNPGIQFISVEIKAFIENHNFKIILENKSPLRFLLNTSKLNI